MLFLNLTSFSQIQYEKKSKLAINEMEALEKCATMQILQQQLREDPEILQRMDVIEQYNSNYSSNLQLKTRSIITIPVVVHIVYRNNTENIPDSRVFDQIDILNKDFRRLNSDAVNTPSVFQSVAADCEINFCLAQRNPAGMFTNGIERYSSNRTTTWIDNTVKEPASGGVAPWDVSKYLNIWVCALPTGVIGFAQFPGQPASTDGVVIGHQYFGKNGTGRFNLGRTASHEVGHWLNLRHIWGDSFCGNDLVNDTPIQQDPNFFCPTFPHVTCSNGPNGDMFMNYMDYTDDVCVSMFTTGQKTRMRATLDGVRSSIKNSDGCQPGYEYAGINLLCYQCIGGSEFEGTFQGYPNAANIQYFWNISGVGFPWSSNCGGGGTMGVYGFHGSSFTLDLTIKCYNREYSSTFSYTPNCSNNYYLKKNIVADNKKVFNNVLNISPNPVSENVFISIQGVENETNQISIVDQYGKSHINLVESNESFKEVNIKNLPNGMYFVVMRTEKGDVISKKIMISH
jgi:hypothetical protein